MNTIGELKKLIDEYCEKYPNDDLLKFKLDIVYKNEHICNILPFFTLSISREEMVAYNECVIDFGSVLILTSEERAIQDSMMDEMHTSFL